MILGENIIDSLPAFRSFFDLLFELICSSLDISDSFIDVTSEASVFI